MKTKSPRAKRCPTVEIASIVTLWFVCSAMAQQEPQDPVLVTNPPSFGTFYWGQNPVPWPFDPSFGTRSVYFWNGAYYVDDASENQQASGFQSEGGGETMSSLSPPGIGGTNDPPPPPPPMTNICSGPTNFSVGYQYSTIGLGLGIALTNPFIALTILTTNSTGYDVFGSTNMAALALPSLSRTNWIWLTRAAGGPTNFSWGQTNWCERYFQLGPTNDYDGDFLSDAYETLSSHTQTNKWDTDDDGLSDWWELQIGLNPLLNESAQTGSRINYTYDGAGRLRQVSGKRTETVTVDAEGNITIAQ